MEEHPKNEKYWKKQHTVNERKIHVRKNYFEVTWIHMCREFLELAIIIVKDNYKSDKILGSTILEGHLEGL